MPLFSFLCDAQSHVSSHKREYLITVLSDSRVFVVEPLQCPSFFLQVFSLLIVAIGVYAKVQKATGTHFFPQYTLYAFSTRFVFTVNERTVWRCCSKHCSLSSCEMETAASPLSFPTHDTIACRIQWVDEFELYPYFTSCHYFHI